MIEAMLMGGGKGFPYSFAVVESNSVRLINPESPDEFIVLSDTPRIVHQIEFMHDGDHLVVHGASNGVTSNSTVGYLMVYNVHTLELVASFEDKHLSGLPDGLRKMKVSRDSKYVSLVTITSSTSQYRNTFAYVFYFTELALELVHKHPLSNITIPNGDIDFSPDSSSFYFIDYDSNLMQFSLDGATAKQIKSVRSPAWQIPLLRVDPDTGNLWIGFRPSSTSSSDTVDLEVWSSDLTTVLHSIKTSESNMVVHVDFIGGEEGESPNIAAVGKERVSLSFLMDRESPYSMIDTSQDKGFYPSVFIRTRQSKDKKFLFMKRSSTGGFMYDLDKLKIYYNRIGCPYTIVSDVTTNYSEATDFSFMVEV